MANFYFISSHSKDLCFKYFFDQGLESTRWQCLLRDPAHVFLPVCVCVCEREREREREREKVGESGRREEDLGGVLHG